MIIEIKADIIYPKSVRENSIINRSVPAVRVLAQSFE